MCPLGDITQLTERGTQLLGSGVPLVLRGALLTGGVTVPHSPSDSTDAFTRANECSSWLSNCDIWSTDVSSASGSTVNPGITCPPNS